MGESHLAMVVYGQLGLQGVFDGVPMGLEAIPGHPLRGHDEHSKIDTPPVALRQLKREEINILLQMIQVFGAEEDCFFIRAHPATVKGPAEGEPGRRDAIIVSELSDGAVV